MSNKEKVAEVAEWNTPDTEGNINVPDYLDKLFNKVGFQLRFHTISEKNEVQTIADIVYISEQFFDQQTASLQSKLERYETALKWITEHPREIWHTEIIEIASNALKAR